MRRSVITSLAILLFLLTACAGAADREDTGIFVYDLSSDMSHIEERTYDMDDTKDLSDKVAKLLQRLIDGPEGDRVHAAIPEEVDSVTYYIGTGTVGVDLGSNFDSIQQMRRILCEAAVVRTLCQLEEVDSVSFLAGKVPITDSKGNAVGQLTPDSFVENDGAMINAYERAELHLFFASEDGQSLVEKVETVTYNSNIPLERLVVDSIILGPQSTDAYATINPATKVNSVTTQDGICYVNLSDDLLNKITNVSDDVMIYSIVNSLTALGNINKVQILVDGGMDVRIGDHELSEVYERKLNR